MCRPHTTMPQETAELAEPEGRSYWAGIWADPEIAPLILQHGRIFTLTQRNFRNALGRTFGSLAGRTILDFGCGDGQLLSPVVCQERILFEPSPVYAGALAELAATESAAHPARVADDVARIAPATVDLVVVHGVAHYIPLDRFAETLRAFRPLLAERSLGVIVADLPHPNRFVDAFGGLIAHPSTVLQIAGQVLQLSRSRYASERLQRHRVRDLYAAANREGFRLRRLNCRSFNRARRTVLFEVSN